MNAKILVALCIAGLAGCAHLQPQEPATLQVQYEAGPHDKTGLIRAFESMGNTVLQFADVAEADPAIYAGNGTEPLPYQVIGQQLAVLQGRHPALRIEANGAEVRIGSFDQAQRSPEPAAAAASVPAQAGATAAPAPALTAIPDSKQVAELRAELESIRRELQALRLLIVTQPADAAPADKRAIDAKLDLLDQRARSARNALR